MFVVSVSGYGLYTGYVRLGWVNPSDVRDTINFFVHLSTIVVRVPV